MKEIRIVKFQGKGRGFAVLDLKSKREREYLIAKVLQCSLSYRKLYKLRNCL